MKPMHVIQAVVLAAGICSASPAWAGISTSPGRDSKFSKAVDDGAKRDRPTIEKMLDVQRIPQIRPELPWQGRAWVLYFSLKF